MDADDTRPTPSRQERDSGRGHNRPAIRFGEAYSAAPLMERLPSEGFLVDSQQTRRLRRQTPQVYFTAGVLPGIRRNLARTPRVETGGLLIGHAFRDLDEPQTSFTLVGGAIPQPSQDSSVGHYTVTPDMITRARHILENNFPGSAVVGWYHSHPGHGIFLSAQDMRIVRSIYNAPWQIAFVRDTIHDKEGVFYGPEGVRLEGWLELEMGAADFLRAADLYSLLQEAPDDQQPELLAQLRSLVNGSPLLGHWRRRGHYQGVPLTAEKDRAVKAAPPPAPVITTAQGEIDLIDQIALFEPSPHDYAAERPPPISPLPPADQGETEAWAKAIEKYHYANELAKSGNIQSGLEILRSIAKEFPNIPHIQDWIRYWEDKDQFSRPRRLGRPDEPYPG